MPVSLADLGEVGVIRRAVRFCPSVSPLLVRGVGDDAAIIRPSGQRHLLLTTDLLVEHIDFNLNGWTLDRVGEKALAVNVSDVAAMGGRPTLFTVGLAIPARARPAQVDALYRGLGRAARRYGVALAGGDLSASPSGWSIEITLLGEVKPGQALTRSGAEVGDRLCVTGTLGDSGAGLDLLRANTSRRTGLGAATRSLPSRAARFLVERHQVPTPRVAQGRALASRGLATAAIDLSDGLASDLRRLCEASGVGAEVDLRALPFSSELLTYARAVKRDPATYALTSGEDFELLVTVAPANLARARSLNVDGVPLTDIGSILPRRAGLRIIDRRGRRSRLTASGFEHFR